MMKKKKDSAVKERNSGFTLAELMVVIAIIAILSAFVTPNLIGWLPNYRLRSAARDIYSNFQKAKLTAIKHHCNCTITFNQLAGGSNYVVFIDSNNDLNYDVGERIIASIFLSNYRSVSFNGITFGNNPAGYPALSFRTNGLPRTGGGGFGGSVNLINTKNREASVVVSLAGNIRID
jgi:type IV fimbrial biogenesis protein FimT